MDSYSHSYRFLPLDHKQQRSFGRWIPPPCHEASRKGSGVSKLRELPNFLIGLGESSGSANVSTVLELALLVREVGKEQILKFWC